MKPSLLQGFIRQNNEHICCLQRFALCHFWIKSFLPFSFFETEKSFHNFPCNSILSKKDLIEQMAQFWWRLLDLSRTHSSKCSFLCCVLNSSTSFFFFILLFLLFFVVVFLLPYLFNFVFLLFCLILNFFLLHLLCPLLILTSASHSPSTHIQPCSPQSSRTNLFLYFIL